MTFLASRNGRSLSVLLAFTLGLFSTGLLQAQTNLATPAIPVANPETGAIPPASTGADTNAPASNPAPANVEAAPTPTPVPSAPATDPAPVVVTAVQESSVPGFSGWMILVPMLTLISLPGLLLYQCGLTRAKNCGHTSTLMLLGVVFGLIGYWIGGFAVQTGGAGDAHAALGTTFSPAEKGALDHELGFMASGHHWGLMGNSGFFLLTDPDVRNGISSLFLMQAAMLAIVLAAAVGAGMERGRLLAMTIGAFLIGVFIYPLFANWAWGGGWLAELGREFGLGHGFVDLGGAGVVHETAGTLALVIALVLGPRTGRFDRHQSANAIPGHNMPFVVLGTFLLLVSWTATNAFSGDSSTAALAATNTLLASMGAVLISFLLAAVRRQRPEPALLCRGLLGGAIASCGCGGLVDPWAGFVIGVVAGLLVQGAYNSLERAGVDDPSETAAIHGMGGAWGVLATGLFANGTEGHAALNGVDGPVRGLFFGGAWHQLAAQAIGCVSGFVVVFILGFAFFGLIHKILGNRVDEVAETEGLDWTETGALGYQGDIDPKE